MTRLKAMREQAGFSLDAFARHVRCVSTRTLAELESGKRSLEGIFPEIRPDIERQFRRVLRSNLSLEELLSPLH